MLEYNRDMMYFTNSAAAAVGLLIFGVIYFVASHPVALSLFHLALPVH